MNNNQKQTSELENEFSPIKAVEKSTMDNKFGLPEAEFREKAVPKTEKRDLSVVFARMKKSMRKKSVSIL